MEQEQEMPAVVPLEPGQIDAAAAMLGRAFCGDPMSAYLFPDASTRQRRITWSMRCMTRFALRYGQVETTPQVDALAGWFRSDVAQITTGRLLRCGMWAGAVRLGLGGLWRCFRVARATHAMQMPLKMPTHWHLLILAVDPARQRSGLGTRLLWRGLDRADREKMPCLLETTTEEAVRFYAKHGFHVAADAQVPGSGVDIWTLMREPGSR